MARMEVDCYDGGNKYGVTVYWTCSPTATSAVVYFNIYQNDYGRTFAIHDATNGSNYNSGSTITVGHVCYLYVYRNGSYSKQDGPFTITAPYAVTYDANGGTGAPAMQEKVPGTALTLSTTAPTRTGYTYREWNTETDGSGTSYQPGESYTADEKLELYAIWDINTWQVTFDANGGTNAPEAQTKVYGTDLTITTDVPSRTGYTFTKWNTEADGSGTDYASGSTYSENAALQLYAIWTINTWPVTYDANGGTGAPEAQVKTYGQTLTLSTVKPTLTGYTFSHWNTKKDGSGDTYSAGTTYTGNEALELHAIWAANQYTVTFNANGGSGYMASQSMTYDTASTLTANSFTRTGYTFIGWARSAGATTAQYIDGASVRNLTASAGGTVPLYAVWSINSITITFDAASNGGSCETKSMQVNYGTAIGTLPTASRKYYVFTGWFTKKTGGTKISTNNAFTENTTLYAQFVIDSSVILKVGGVWKNGIPYIRVNGEWKKGYAWVKANGTWKQGIG